MDSDYGIAAVVGAVLPLAIAIVLQSNWTKPARSVIAFLLCAAAAIVTNIFTDTVQFDDPAFDWATWFGTVYGAAMVTYAALWKPTGVESRIESKTNLSGPDGA